MSVFRPNPRHFREVSIFYFHLEKTAAKALECFQILTVKLLLVKERVMNGFNTSRSVILMSRIGMAVEKRKVSKIPNWKHYLLKTHAKRKKNW